MKYINKTKSFDFLLKKLRKNFTSNLNANSNTSLYIWISNVYPGIRTEDMKNFMKMSNTPKKIEYFEGKNPINCYCGPRHTGVITKDGDLYTFGTGKWGVLGHGDETSVNFDKPKLVEYFKNNNIKIKKICLGDFHSLALTTDGDLYSWGFEGDKGILGFFRRDPGALGHDTWKSCNLPKRINYFYDKGIKIKDISCSVLHSVALSTEGRLYTFGKGAFGLLGSGSTRDQKLPEEVELLKLLYQENSLNEIVKIDCADEYTGALTKGGDLYVWGKNNSGQLGVGSGTGLDMIESESYPTQVVKSNPNMNIVDFSCGENGMMIKSEDGIIYKTGWRIDYNMSEYKISRKIKTKLFFCGNSYYCIIDEDNKIYQWGNLFKDNKAELIEDMNKINSDNLNLFDKREIQSISGKFRVCGAIVK